MLNRARRPLRALIVLRDFLLFSNNIDGLDRRHSEYQRRDGYLSASPPARLLWVAGIASVTGRAKQCVQISEILRVGIECDYNYGVHFSNRMQAVNYTNTFVIRLMQESAQP